MKPGTIVIATYGRRNPDSGREWTGQLLDACDPEAWVGSLAFADAAPTRAQVEAHIARCEARGIDMCDRVPVRWAFGRVFWERAENLRSAC